MRTAAAAGDGGTMKPTQAPHEAGQSLWLDNITRALLDEAFADNGTVGELLPADGGDADQVIAAFARAGIDAASLAGGLPRQGAEAFAASWQDLLARIGARHEQLSR
jgi:hypothetical protein